MTKQRISRYEFTDTEKLERILEVCSRDNTGASPLLAAWKLCDSLGWDFPSLAAVAEDRSGNRFPE